MRDFEVADRSKERVLLASPIGLKYKFLPVGIAILKSYLSKRSTFQVDTLSLCVTFSEYLARNHPSLTIYDTQMGEWGSSFHELYFATKYFNHADPRHLLGETLADYLRKQDIFQVGPWEAVETYSEEIHHPHRPCFRILPTFGILFPGKIKAGTGGVSSLCPGFFVHCPAGFQCSIPCPVRQAVRT